MFRLGKLGMLFLALGLANPLGAATYHVSPRGQDDPARDGLSPAAARASLAYACERVPEGPHTLQLAAGTYTATRRARPKNGFTIQGEGLDGDKTTRVIASREWKLVESIGPDEDESKYQDEYLLAFRPGQNITIRNLELASSPDHPISGAIFCRDGRRILCEDLRIQNFRWNGLRLEFSEDVTVRRCQIRDASSAKRGRVEGGLIRTRWLRDSRIHDNQIQAQNSGYGYKGGGHERVRIDHNAIDVRYFAIECAHENEFGVEIDHNHLTRCVSVPKSGPSADPATRKCPYTFWIHDNFMTDSYTIEGPRNHLRVSHNFIAIDKPGGRIYTHHGGINHGPIWIDHNVIENVDRAVIWMNNGLAENIYFVNNSVTCADAGTRADALVAAYEANRLNNWVVRNNILIALESQPRKLHSMNRGVPTKIVADHNMLVRVTDAPAGNFLDWPLPWEGRGHKPWAYYQPRANAPTIDRGIELPRPFWGTPIPFVGKAPDLGAMEFGEKLRLWEVPALAPDLRLKAPQSPGP